MAAPVVVSICIPITVLKELSSTYLFGHYRCSFSNVFVNCTIGLENKEILDIAVKNLHKSIHEEPFETCQTFCFFGILYSSKRRKTFKLNFLEHEDSPISFVLRVDDVCSSFHLEKMCIGSSSTKVISQVIVYDSRDLMSSRLLFFDRKNYLSSNQQNELIIFLCVTCKSNAKYSEILSTVTEKKSTSFIDPVENYFFPLFIYRTFSMLTVLSSCGKNTSIPIWVYRSVLKVITFTRVGRQFHQRFLHSENIGANIEANKSLTLRCKNLISSILIDLVCGWFITFTLLQSNLPSLLLDTSIEQTNLLVSGLKSLIYWLMGVPAGLKLNIPLNSTLGHFFLYHIYLWEAYMAVVLPVFTLVLKISTIIGIIGATFVLCLLSDLVSLATVHIYCFYGYATRLYGYQMLSLSALWRLFRGKKWNPLRQRVDSYTYDIHQLFLGTLIFTVLLFLLPTVMVYYFVFTSLRIMVLIIQGIISKIVNAISVCPLYSVISRICSFPETTGDVYFTVLNTQGTLVLSMQTSQVSLMDVIKATLPDLHSYDEYLSWKDFLSSIVWGKIIYPL